MQESVSVGMRSKRRPRAEAGRPNAATGGRLAGAETLAVRDGFDRAHRGVDEALAADRRALQGAPSLGGAAIRNLTNPTEGRLWFRPQDLRQAVLGEPARGP